MPEENIFDIINYSVDAPDFGKQKDELLQKLQDFFMQCSAKTLEKAKLLRQIVQAENQIKGPAESNPYYATYLNAQFRPNKPDDRLALFYPKTLFFSNDSDNVSSIGIRIDTPGARWNKKKIRASYFILTGEKSPTIDSKIVRTVIWQTTTEDVKRHEFQAAHFASTINEPPYSIKALAEMYLAEVPTQGPGKVPHGPAHVAVSNIKIIHETVNNYLGSEVKKLKDTYSHTSNIVDSLKVE